MSIVIAEDLWWPVPAWLAEKYELLYDPDLHKRPEQLAVKAKSAKALILRNKTQLTEALIDQLPNLRVVGRLGVGLDNIDMKACHRRGITVIAARGCNANAVAEYVIASLFEHARFLHRCDAQVRQGVWNRQAAIGVEISGKTMGLIGVGDIGQRVALRARALGMRVMVCDPFLLPWSMPVQDLDLTMTDLEGVCRNADYISIHVPLTPGTHHLISSAELEWMKDTTVIVNTSRGGIIDESALLHSLERKPKRMAVLDVRETEPPPPDDPLRLLPNVVMTPHIAGITEESSERVASFILREVDHALSGQDVQGIVI